MSRFSEDNDGMYVLENRKRLLVTERMRER